MRGEVLCLPDQLGFVHPVAPYTLDVDGCDEFLAKFVGSRLLGLVWVVPPTSETGKTFWAIVVFKDIVVVIFVLGVVDGGGASLGGA